MTSSQEKLLAELLEAFSIEAAERITSLTEGLLKLEKESSAEIVEIIFREFHSLKGAARSIDRTDIERICQTAESVFSLLKRNELKITPVLMKTLFSSVDYISESIKHSGGEARELLKPQYSRLLEVLKNAAAKVHVVELQEEESSSLPAPEQEIEPEKVFKTEKAVSGSGPTIRVSLNTLDQIMNQIEELREIKLMASQQSLEVSELSREISFYQRDAQKKHRVTRMVRQLLKKHETDEEVKQVVPVLEKLMAAHGSHSALIKSVNGKAANLFRSAEHYSHSVNARLDSLLMEVKRLLMMPFARAVEGFPKLIRDLAVEQGKRVDLVITGEDIEVDKRVLEEIKDPLMHLLRNGLDHGIEVPEERMRKGKSPNAKIGIAASMLGSQNMEIRVFDDGAGINIPKLRDAVRKNNILTADELNALSEMEVLQYIFHSGISTKAIITDISGRGLGMAIVREKIEKLGGSISLETAKDKGTTFHLNLPLTLSAFRGVLIKTGGLNYVIPSTNIERVLVVKRDKIKTLENREAVEVNNEMVSVVKMDSIIGLKSAKPQQDAEVLHLVLLQSKGIHIAFEVDEIIGEQELIVKDLGRQLAQVKNISGSTVLGDRRLVLILDAVGIIKTASELSSVERRRTQFDDDAQEGKAKQKVLVAEDSITSRLLLKNILESAGYEVNTAFDGADAFEQLLIGDYDLLVSDVDMPRMNGFILTEKVRRDKRLTDIPVILVTSLESREDRERGIDVGASAYIVKKSFDQSNLLEIVSRLI